MSLVKTTKIENKLFDKQYGFENLLSLKNKASEAKTAIQNINQDGWKNLDEFGKMRALQQIKFKSDQLDNVDRKLQKYVNISSTLRAEIAELGEQSDLAANLMTFMDAFDKVTNRGKNNFEKNMAFNSLINEQRQMAIQKKMEERKAYQTAKLQNSLFLALRD